MIPPRRYEVKGPGSRVEGGEDRKGLGVSRVSRRLPGSFAYSYSYPFLISYSDFTIIISIVPPWYHDSMIRASDGGLSSVVCHAR